MVDQKKYLKMFISEAKENLEVLNNSLLKIEKNPADRKFATELMRAAHTLKSSAAAMGQRQMSQLAHAIEDIFDEVRSGKSRFFSSNSDIIFAAFDLINKSLLEIKEGRFELDTASVIEKLKSIQPEADPSLTENQKESKPDEVPEGVELAEKPEAIRPIEEIKVDIKTLDSLMNLSEELLVNKMRLSEILAKKKYEEFPVAIDMLGRLVSDTQYNVMQARMIPLGQIFDRFPRMVRDLANKEKKTVDLELWGGEIELDRTIIDKIGEPLVHLLRNAVDHGIETKGKVRLKARREKSYVIIEVINEGNSIDWEAVIEAAFVREIINRDKRDKYTKEIVSWSHGFIAKNKNNETMKQLSNEIIDLIYHPELSTSEKITETSGRGIGLNIVKTRVESLGGAVSVESPIEAKKQENPAGSRNAINRVSTTNGAGNKTIKQSEGGAKFTLKLPLTIAIIQALLIKAGDQTYAIPIINVDRSVKILPDLIKKAFDREVAIVDKKDIPLVRLEKLFNIETRKQQSKKTRKQKSELAVIIKKTLLLDTGEEEERPVFGLVVDSLVGEQDIIIKPLVGILKQNKGFAGITILGDGSPALILDVASLV